jgi:hypothetical protein
MTEWVGGVLSVHFRKWNVNCLLSVLSDDWPLVLWGRGFDTYTECDLSDTVLLPFYSSSYWAPSELFQCRKQNILINSSNIQFLQPRTFRFLTKRSKLYWRLRTQPPPGSCVNFIWFNSCPFNNLQIFLVCDYIIIRQKYPFFRPVWFLSVSVSSYKPAKNLNRDDQLNW